MTQSSLGSDSLPGGCPDALEDEVLEESEHLLMPPLRPENLRVSELHLQHLGGPQHRGELVSNLSRDKMMFSQLLWFLDLEQFSAGERLGQEAAIGPDVSWCPRRRRLSWSVIIDGGVTVVPPPVLDNPGLHPHGDLLHEAELLLTLVTALVAPGSWL